MITTRAKFQCVSETRHSYGQEGARTYKFQAINDPEAPENERFCKYTPSGSLEICVDNPNVQFELGRFYYLDFTPAEMAGPF